MVLEPATPPGEHNVELVHTDDKWKWLPYFSDNTFDHVEPYTTLAVSEHFHFPWTNGEPRE